MKNGSNLHVNYAKVNLSMKSNLCCQQINKIVYRAHIPLPYLKVRYFNVISFSIIFFLVQWTTYFQN